MSAIVIAVANNKGGVGKTALVTNVGAVFARRGFNTLLIDFDGQANLTDSFLAESQVETSIAAALREKKRLPVVPIRENLSIVPSTASTGMLDRKDVDLLKGAIQPELAKYDLIMIDTPPTIGPHTMSALFCAQELIVPLCAELSSLKGLNALYRLVAAVQKGSNRNIHILAAVLTFFDGRKNLSKFIVGKIEQGYKGLLCKTTIRRNIAVTEAGLKRTDVYSYDRKSKASQDYEDLAGELLKRLNVQM